MERLAQGGLVGPAGPSGAPGSSGLTLNVTNNLDARGADPSVLPRVRALLQESEARTVKKAVSAVVDARMRGGPFGRAFD